MTTASFRAAALGALRSANLELTAGRYVVLALEAQPLSDLIALASGREPPRAGRVLLNGVPPSGSAGVRRHTAALFAEESLPPDRSVLGSVGRALTARGDSEAQAKSVLDAAGLGQLAGALPSALSQRELRSVSLALSLAHGQAELFALHEPLATLIEQSLVLEALDRHTARGAIVLTTTTSSADATLLGGDWLCVELGRLEARSGPPPRLGAGPWQQILVESTDAPGLSRLLRDSPLGLSSDLAGLPEQLRVVGPALELTVREVIALARSSGIEIRRITASVPPVEALMAARAGFARGAYEAARAAAVGPLPPVPTQGGFT